MILQTMFRTEYYPGRGRGEGYALSAIKTIR